MFSAGGEADEILDKLPFFFLFISLQISNRVD